MFTFFQLTDLHSTYNDYYLFVYLIPDDSPSKGSYYPVAAKLCVAQWPKVPDQKSPLKFCQNILSVSMGPYQYI